MDEYDEFIQYLNVKMIVRYRLIIKVVVHFSNPSQTTLPTITPQMFLELNFSGGLFYTKMLSQTF